MNELQEIIRKGQARRGGTRPWILFADIDGTLVGPDMKLSSKDRAAILDFMDQGHYFTLATGRGRTNAEAHMKETPTNFPAIFANGALLYDRKQEAILKEYTFSTQGLKPLFDLIQKEVPEAMIQLYDANSIDLITPNGEEDPRVQNHHPFRRIEFSQVEGKNCNKVLFGLSKETCDGAVLQAAEYLLAHRPDLRVVKSQAQYMELTPQGVSKGHLLAEIQESVEAKIAVAGDYYNDVEMMQKADRAYTLTGAPKDVQKYCDQVYEARPGSFIARVIQDLLERSAKGE
ncbi:hypothetical protein ABB02_00209 [Clostridiaceae bacterium JG1575]|nr:hypothetical protein ABB02_00209 [Clostridiaceae bacterium JG1575]